jgi:protein TonB
VHAPGSPASTSGQSTPASAATAAAAPPQPANQGTNPAGDTSAEATREATLPPPGDAPATQHGEGDPKLEFLGADPTDLPAAADTGNRAPPYPDEAYERGEQGTVVLRLHIAEDGRVERIEIAQSSGSPVLDAAAQETLATWHFHPARHQGRPVPSYRDQPVRFLLDEGD